jgi:hypothetical protein
MTLEEGFDLFQRSAPPHTEVEAFICLFPINNYVFI